MLAIIWAWICAIVKNNNANNWIVEDKDCIIRNAKQIMDYQNSCWDLNLGSFSECSKLAREKFDCITSYPISDNSQSNEVYNYYK